MSINKYNINEAYPNFKNIAGTVVKVVTWNLDGSTSEFKFSYPRICSNLDDTTSAAVHLGEWVKEMTRYYLSIRAYKIFVGSLWKDGTETYSISFDQVDIPENKIFIAGNVNQGRWVTYEEAKDITRAETVKFMEQNMNNGRNASSGEEIPPEVNSAAWRN